MKSLLRFLAVGALLTLTKVYAGNFEGKMTLAITDARSGTVNLDYSLKGDKVRMDTNARDQSMGMIMDTAKQEMIILMAEQNMYMVMPMKKAVDQAMEKAGANTADVEVTGKTETILGYKCSQIIVKDKGTVT